MKNKQEDPQTLVIAWTGAIGEPDTKVGAFKSLEEAQEKLKDEVISPTEGVHFMKHCPLGSFIVEPLAWDKP